ncbi:368_t:CDS:2, partial [Racocetra fulgida]
IKKLFFKPIKDKSFEKVILKMASSNTPGFKYLKFFKPEYHTEIAELLQERPTLKDVITLVLQNPERESDILTNCKIKAIRFDDSQMFDFESEADINNGWIITDEGSEWFDAISSSEI